MAIAEAGLRQVTLTVDDEAMAVTVLYPSTAPTVDVRLGPYVLDVAMGGAWLPGAHPLVVISHGSGGAPLTHRELARHLARAGFVVLLPEHPRNNRQDNSLAGTAEILARRPRHVQHAIDWVASADGLGASVDASRVGVVGHSLGGYTALALAGGRPTTFPNESPDGQRHAVPVTPDARVAALALLAPATVWFMAPGALDEITVPVLLLTAEHDRQAPSFHGDIVRDGIGAQLVTHRDVAGAGHYSFLAPFPPQMSQPSFAPSQDPHGFDRVAFHAALYPEVEAFLTRHLQRL